MMFECFKYADLKAKHFNDEQGQLYCDVSKGQAAAADIWPKLPPVAVAEFLMDVLRERGRMEEEDAVQLGGESDGSFELEGTARTTGWGYLLINGPSAI